MQTIYLLYRYYTEKKIKQLASRFERIDLAKKAFKQLAARKGKKPRNATILLVKKTFDGEQKINEVTIAQAK